MKVWFDISNSPHVNMFLPVIMELRKMGHDIFITSRPLANTIALLQQSGLEHKVVGRHYGKNILMKMWGFPIRVFQLIVNVRKANPDIAVSQSSFHSPLVAWILGIRSLYTNDNEHAKGNHIAFLFASQIMIPESMLLPRSITNYFIARKIIRYPGIKEGIYLWEKASNPDFKNGLAFPKKEQIYVRPEPNTAQYYNGKHNFLDEVLLVLQYEYDITVLTRDKKQFDHYSKPKFFKLHVPEKPIPFHVVAGSCSLFIGAGGSMTRELALMGVPAISVYQSKLLGVDEYLLKKGLLNYDPNLSIETVRKTIQLQKRLTDSELVQKGMAAYHLLMNEITRTQAQSLN